MKGQTGEVRGQEWQCDALGALSLCRVCVQPFSKRLFSLSFVTPPRMQFWKGATKQGDKTYELPKEGERLHL